MNEQTFRALFPNSSRDLLAANRGLLDTLPQPDQAPALDSAKGGEAQGVERITVRFTGFRCRCLDPDNFAGSVKDLLDGLRHAQLLPGDSPWQIRLETEQVRVAKKSAECTKIIITYP